MNTFSYTAAGGFVAALDAALRLSGGSLSESEMAFARRVYAGGGDRYLRRLTQYGFVDQTKVLDAGCGFGQWSVALARLNASVDAVDGSADRIAVVRSISEQCGIANLNARRASLYDLPFVTGSFSAVFCYSVLPFTLWKEALRELVRVLAPGGRLYVNANDFGWYKFLWYTEHNKGPGYDPRAMVGNVFANTLRYERGEELQGQIDLIIDSDRLIDEMKMNGLVNIEMAQEGMVRASRDAKAEPFLVGEYRGDRAVFEVLAEKPA